LIGKRRAASRPGYKSAGCSSFLQLPHLRKIVNDLISAMGKGNVKLCPSSILDAWAIGAPVQEAQMQVLGIHTP
jgi:hypothetical protein